MSRVARVVMSGFPQHITQRMGTSETFRDPPKHYWATRYVRRNQGDQETMDVKGKI